jgi:hypothetical protein
MPPTYLQELYSATWELHHLYYKDNPRLTIAISIAQDDHDNQGLLHGDALIEAGGSDEDGEFSASDFDADSVISRSDSTSISSSILEHSFQNGRRYHRYRHGRYPIPNDEAEQNREDMLHAMMLEATDGKLFYAPIGDYPQKIIDLGTGTGIWALESMRA